MNLKFIWILFLAIIVGACGGATTEGTDEEASGEEEAAATEEVAAPNILTQSEVDEGWVLLFDGESSAGWRSYCKETFPTGWEIVDGTINCIGSGRGEAGDGVLFHQLLFQQYSIDHSEECTPFRKLP